LEEEVKAAGKRHKGEKEKEMVEEEVEGQRTTTEQLTKGRMEVCEHWQR